MVTRREISDEAWTVIAPFFPTRKPVGRPILDMRQVVEAIAWRFRTGSPWRDVPERFGNWNSIYSYFSDWCKDGTWEQVLAAVQTGAQRAGDLEWTVAIDSTIMRVHQHGASLSRGPSRDTGGLVELQDSA
jgi:transposase